jgi:hypothetical protein
MMSARKRLKEFAILFLFAALGVTPWAQQNAPVKPRPPRKTHANAAPAANPAPAPATSQIARPQPSPEIQKLATMMSGRWTTREQFFASASVAQNGSGRGMDVIHSGPGGLSLVSEYNSSGSSGKFSGLGVILWQADLESYLLYWTDNIAPGMLLLRGNWQGDKLVFSGDTTSGGSTVYIKQTYSDFTKSSFTFTEESAVQGGPLQQDVEVRFTRAETKGHTSHRSKSP